MIWPYLRTGSSCCDRRDRHLVAARHALARGLRRPRCCRPELVDGDDDIVVRRQTNEARSAHWLTSYSTQDAFTR